MDQQTYFTFSMKFGDVQSAHAVDPHAIELSKLLNTFCNKSYSPHLDRFAPEARVDGKRWKWGFEGCEHVLLDAEQRCITIRIGVPESRWLDKSSEEIRGYLFNQFEQALRLMVEKIKTEKLIVDDSKLFEDFSIVKEKYLYTS